MPLKSESDELLKAEMGQEPSPKGMVDRSLDGWNMFRASVSKESNSSIADIGGGACGWWCRVVRRRKISVKLWGFETPLAKACTAP